MNISYSKEFRKIIEDEKEVSKLIVDSWNESGSWEVWEKIRYFASEAFEKEGSVLDVGCANGFFLRCLMEWAPCKIVPYGIDIDQKLIADAKELLSDFKDNFYAMDAFKIAEIKKAGFPETFDYIYSFPLDNTTFNFLRGMLSPEGKIIIAFYGSNKYKAGTPLFKKERAALFERIKTFESDCVKFDRIIENPQGTNHIIGIISKS